MNTEADNLALTVSCLGSMTRTQPSSRGKPRMLNVFSLNVSNLKREGEKGAATVPHTGGTTVPGWASGQNHPM